MEKEKGTFWCKSGKFPTFESYLRHQRDCGDIRPCACDLRIELSGNNIKNEAAKIFNPKSNTEQVEGRFNWGTPLEDLAYSTQMSMLFGTPESAYYFARQLFHDFFHFNPNWRNCG